jgi:hypothetical protein
LCILPGSLGIIVINLNPDSFDNFFIGIFLLFFALILLIPGIILLNIGIKEDRNKIIESEASNSDYNFQSYSGSETDNSNKKEKK